MNASKSRSGSLCAIWPAYVGDAGLRDITTRIAAGNAVKIDSRSAVIYKETAQPGID